MLIPTTNLIIDPQYVQDCNMLIPTTNLIVDPENVQDLYVDAHDHGLLWLGGFQLLVAWVVEALSQVC